MGASNTSKVLQTQPDKKNKKNPPFFDKFYTYIYMHACMHVCILCVDCCLTISWLFMDHSNFIVLWLGPLQLLRIWKVFHHVNESRSSKDATLPPWSMESMF